MSEAERNEIVNAAIRNIADLIAGNNSNLYSNLISIFNSKVKIYFDAKNDNPNFAAGCSSSASLVDGKNNNIDINVNLRTPPISRKSIEYNWWIVDIHHELFHAFTKLLNSGKLTEQTDNKTILAATGGKISIFSVNNGVKVNSGDLQVSLLFNELTTDLMAYILTYTRFLQTRNINVDGILHSVDLESIANTFGYKNGYYELLQLGLFISEAFTNYPVNYDNITQNRKSFFDLETNNMQYNDLFYSIMYNPLILKNKLLESLSNDDWNSLNENAKIIMSSFQNRGRTIEKESIAEVMKIIKKYFTDKIEKMRNQKIDEIRIQLLEKHFEERYQYVANYYGITELVDESNIRNVR